MKMRSIICGGLLLVLGALPASASDLAGTIAALKQGGHVMVFRHAATDDSQKDVYPLNFDDMKAQRQLSEKGRETARQIGAAMRELGIPIGEVYASRLNRAIEMGKLLSGKDVAAVEALTDSGGSASGMANPTGANAKAGLAIRELVNAAPKTGTNNLLVTHKTNFADAFGKEAGGVQEGEAFIYKPDGAGGAAAFVGRIKAEEWISQARMN